LSATSEVETEFNKKYTDQRKYVDLTLEISVNINKGYSQLLDWRFTKYLLKPSSKLGRYLIKLIYRETLTIYY